MVARKGAIAFALVYIPIEFTPATQDDTVRFNQLAKDSMKRVRYVKTCPDCKRELEQQDIVKGYQYGKGKYVVVSDKELEAIKTEADRAIKILQFSDLDEVAPVYFQKAYHLQPQPGGEKAFELLRQAMADENKVALGTTVLGNSETPVAIISNKADLLMITLYYQSEVKENPLRTKQPKVDEAELSMAKMLIENMTEPFDPGRFKNTYKEKLMNLIHNKIAGKQIESEAPATQPRNVISLMDALQASLKDRKDEMERPTKRSRRSFPKKAS